MKKILFWPTPLLKKWFLSLMICLPFLVAAIVSAFSGDRTFLILSFLLFLICVIRCVEFYLMLINKRYQVVEGVCLSVSVIAFQRQRKVVLQESEENQIIFYVEKSTRLSVGQAYRVFLPSKAVLSGTATTILQCPSALAIEKCEKGPSLAMQPE